MLLTWSRLYEFRFSTFKNDDAQRPTLAAGQPRVQAWLAFLTVV